MAAEKVTPETIRDVGRLCRERYKTMRGPKRGIKCHKNAGLRLFERKTKVSKQSGNYRD